MNTYNSPKVASLDNLNDEIAVQQMLVSNHNKDSWYTLEEAQEGLRKAKEALRVFKYRAKPALTKSGKVIRR